MTAGRLTCADLGLFGLIMGGLEGRPSGPLASVAVVFSPDSSEHLPQQRDRQHIGSGFRQTRPLLSSSQKPLTLAASSRQARIMHRQPRRGRHRCRSCPARVIAGAAFPIDLPRGSANTQQLASRRPLSTWVWSGTRVLKPRSRSHPACRPEVHEGGGTCRGGAAHWRPTTVPSTCCRPAAGGSRMGQE